MSLRIVGDWGTTRLRLSTIDPDGRVVARRDGPGIGQLVTPVADALLDTLGDWTEPARATGIVLCGMAGSRDGLAEAPYSPCPAGFADWSMRLAETEVSGIAIRIAGGLSGANFAGAPDVMRGEETQIFGALAIDPALAERDRLLVLPGTHSKWAELGEGRVRRFQTSLTGELFALLRDRSILARPGGEANDEAGFAAGLARICETEALIASLFEARAAQLVDGRSRAWAVGFLSGLVIGAEVIENLRLTSHYVGEPIVLIGAPGLCRLYALALAARGHGAVIHDGDQCALAGLIALDEHKDPLHAHR